MFGWHFFLALNLAIKQGDKLKNGSLQNEISEK